MKEKEQLQFIKIMGGTTFGGYLIQTRNSFRDV